MKKKIVTLLIMICCIFTCAMVLVACGSDPGNGGVGGTVPGADGGSESIGTCVVNFNTRGGESVSSMSTTANGSDILLPTPMRKAYLFRGWYDNAELTGNSMSTIKANSGTNNLYAKWQSIYSYEDLGWGACRVTEINPAINMYEEYEWDCLYVSTTIIDDYGANFTDVKYGISSISGRPGITSVEVVQDGYYTCMFEESAIKTCGYITKITTLFNGLYSGDTSVFSKVVHQENRNSIEEIVFTGVCNFVDGRYDSQFDGFVNLKRIEFTDTSTINNNGIPQCLLRGLPKLEEAVFDCEFYVPLVWDKDCEVGEYAFEGCASLKSITIGNDIEKIGEYAFCQCTALESVVFESESKLHEIAAGAFAYCSISHIDIPNTVEVIGDNAFAYCTALGNITLPNELKVLGAYAFTRCDSITEVTIPSSVEEIGLGVFQLNNRLESAIFDANAKITILLDALFMQCDRLTELDLTPLTNLSIMGNVFSFCSMLNTVKLPSTLDTISDSRWLNNLPRLSTIETNGCTAINMVDGMIMSKDNKTIYTSLPNVDYGTLNIPSGVEEIEDYAFSKEGVEIEHLILSDSMKKLGENSFEGVSTIKTISLNQGLEVIGGGAFSGCVLLHEAFIPKTVNNFGISVFDNCTSLEIVEFEKGSLVEYMYHFLYNCPSIETLVLPFLGESIDDPTSIHYFFLDSIDGDKHGYPYKYPQYVSPKLTTVKVLSGTIIGEYVFAKLDSIKNVYLPSTITTISYNFLKYDSLDASSTEYVKLDFIESPITTYIHTKTFSWNTTKTSVSSGDIKYIFNTKVEKVIIPSTMQRLYASMFEGYTNLKEIVFDGDSQLKEIPNKFVKNCLNLTTFILPKNLTFGIGTEAFAYSGISGEIDIPSNASFNVSAFAGCTNITAFDIEEGHSKYSSNDGLLLSATQNVLYIYPASKSDEHYIIPNTISTIQSSAFENCKYLKHLEIPHKLSSMRGALIDVGDSLKTITMCIEVLGTGLTSNPAYTWFTSDYDSTVTNSSIKHIIFTNGTLTQEIDLKGLSSLIGLVSIELPSMVKEIIDGAIHTSVKELTINNAALYTSITGTTGVNSFMSHITKLYVPKTIVDDANNVNEYLNDMTMYTKVVGGDYYIYTKA